MCSNSKKNEIVILKNRDALSIRILIPSLDLFDVSLWNYLHRSERTWLSQGGKSNKFRVNCVERCRKTVALLNLHLWFRAQWVTHSPRSARFPARPVADSDALSSPRGWHRAHSECARRVFSCLSCSLARAAGRSDFHSVLFARGPRCCARSARKPRDRR